MRLNVEMSDEAYKELTETAQLIELNISETVRRAIRLLSLVSHLDLEEDRLVVEHINGSKERLVLL